MKTPSLPTLLAWIGAAGSFTITGFCVAKLARASDPLTGAGLGLIGCGACILGVTLISGTLTRLIFSPLLWLIEGKMRPESWVKPPLDYRLARFYAAQGRHADAIEEYLRIAEHYPLEEDAYLEGIHQACLLRDAASAEVLSRRWKRALPRIEAARNRRPLGSAALSSEGDRQRQMPILP